MTKKSSAFAVVLIACGGCFFLPSAVQSSGNKTEADLKVYAVNANGDRLQNLVAGEYVALIVEADTGVFPDRVAAGLSARASFATRILGQTVSYSVSLPVATASSNSRRDPTTGSPTSGEKLGNELQNKIWSERLDFYVPREAPEGIVKVTIRANAVSAKPVSRTFTFNVVRPR